MADLSLQNASQAGLTCDSPWPSCLSTTDAVLLGTAMTSLMLFIASGNLMVVLTITCDEKLRAQLPSWLLVSLAMADLLVGLLVMPLTMVYEIIGEWTFGDTLCQIWLAMDVFFVTASILHISVISVDRYLAVSQPLIYPSRRTKGRMLTMIGLSWCVSLLVCLPPILGWRAEHRQPGDCTVSQDIGYVLYSSLGSFYIPLTVIVTVYARIYVLAKRRNHQRLSASQRIKQTLRRVSARRSRRSQGKTAEEERKEILEGLSDGVGPAEINPKDVHVGFERPFAVASELFLHFFQQPIETTRKLSTMRRTRVRKDYKTNIEQRRRSIKIRERQSTILLGLIIGAFTVCWMPFFVTYVLRAFDVEVPSLLFKVFFWLGYCNSAVNPMIYTFFNRDFKRALSRQTRRLRDEFEEVCNCCFVY